MAAISNPDSKSESLPSMPAETQDEITEALLVSVQYLNRIGHDRDDVLVRGSHGPSAKGSSNKVGLPPLTHSDIQGAPPHELTRYRRGGSAPSRPASNGGRGGGRGGRAAVIGGVCSGQGDSCDGGGARYL